MNGPRRSVNHVQRSRGPSPISTSCVPARHPIGRLSSLHQRLESRPGGQAALDASALGKYLQTDKVGGRTTATTNVPDPLKLALPSSATTFTNNRRPGTAGNCRKKRIPCRHTCPAVLPHQWYYALLFALRPVV